jgi:DNA recombination-mediator protein A
MPERLRKFDGPFADLSRLSPTSSAGKPRRAEHPTSTARRRVLLTRRHELYNSSVESAMTQQQLAFGNSVALTPVVPMLEMGAYESLWLQTGMTFPRLASLFRGAPSSRPSDLVEEPAAIEAAEQALTLLRTGGTTRFGVRIYRAGEYPAKLRDAKHPVELLYFQGWWDLVETRSVAVVGTRHPTAEGTQKARQIAESLVADDFTVVSGLATGIDTAAHTAALDAGGRTIAVLGTPLARHTRLRTPLFRHGSPASSWSSVRSRSSATPCRARSRIGFSSRSGT